MIVSDPVELSAPRRSWIGVGLFFLSLGVYGLTLSRTPFPGLPAETLAQHLGLEGSWPGMDLVWGWMIRRLDRLRGVPVATSAAWLSAICGAACVGLTAWLMQRVHFLGLTVDQSPDRIRREAQARRISSLIAGLYLGGCIPFWVASTRSLPATLYLLLLLLAACLFSEYQRTGSLWRLGLLGLLYGGGMSVSSTFVLYLPVAIVLLLREWMRQGVIGRWRPYAIFGSGWLLGLGLYPLQLALLRWSATEGSLWVAWLDMLGVQMTHFYQIRLNAGFVAILFFATVPWLLIFPLSRRSPWYYELDQIIVRHVFMVGLLAILYNAPFAFWNFLGMDNLMLTPHLLLATCMGYMGGEMWIIGGVAPASDAHWLRRAYRWFCAGTGLVLPAIVLAGSAQNLGITDGRPGRMVHEISLELLDRMQGRDILFTHGGLEQSLRLAARERGQPLLLINVMQMSSPVYLSQLAQAFPDSPIAALLQRGQVSQFVSDLLLDDGLLRQVAILHMTDLFREFSHLDPDGFLYRLEVRSDDISLEGRLATQRPFWVWMGRIASQSFPKGSLLRRHHQYICKQAAAVANNLGVALMEAGNEAGAMEAFASARRFDPENAAALMNDLDLARSHNRPDLEEVEEQWAGCLALLGSDRWALSQRHGYLWNARAWLESGHAWALSGDPHGRAAARREPYRFEVDELRRDLVLSWLYLPGRGPPPDRISLHSRLARDDRDLEALQDLARFSLWENDPVAAEAYLNVAKAKGMPPEQMAVDQIMAAWLRHGTEETLRVLQYVVRVHPSNARAWLAIALLSETNSALQRQALRSLRDVHDGGMGWHLALAWGYLNQGEWDAARVAIEAAVELEPRSTLAWEMMLALAQITETPRLFQSSRKVLLEEDAGHPLQAIRSAIQDLQREDPRQAEERLKAALSNKRYPEVLFILARIVSDDHRQEEAEELLQEALIRQPYHPDFRLFQVERLLERGHLDEARPHIDWLQRSLPGNLKVQWVDLQWHLAGPNPERAVGLIEKLAARRDELSASQAAQLQRWGKELTGL